MTTDDILVLIGIGVAVWWITREADKTMGPASIPIDMDPLNPLVITLIDGVEHWLDPVTGRTTPVRTTDWMRG